MKLQVLLLLLCIGTSFSLLPTFQRNRGYASSRSLSAESIGKTFRKFQTSSTALHLAGDGGGGKNLVAEVNGANLCYDFYKATSPVGPPVVYLPGLIRQKTDAKSINLQQWCKRTGLSYFCSDYVGVGRSTGKFTDGSVGRWADDTIALIDTALKPKDGKVVLVGHGVGSWIAFIIAKKRPDLVSGIVGMAADPDFTEELLWKRLPEDVKNKIMTEGVADIVWGKEKYPISRNLIEDGRKNLLLKGGAGSIPVTCPVRLIHGLLDEEVPHTLALQLVDNVASSDASVVLLKQSTHSMDTEQDFKTMRSMILEVLTAFKGDFDLRSPGSG